MFCNSTFSQQRRDDSGKREGGGRFCNSMVTICFLTTTKKGQFGKREVVCFLTTTKKGR